MATKLKNKKTEEKTIKSLRCYAIRAAISRLDVDGKQTDEVSLRLEGEDLPAEIAAAIEEIQRKKEEGEDAVE